MVVIYRIDNCTPMSHRPYRVQINGKILLTKEGNPVKLYSMEHAQSYVRKLPLKGEIS